MDHDFELTEATVQELERLREQAGEFVGVLDSASSVLSGERDEHQGAFDEASERWQNSKRGQAVMMWLTDLDALLDVIDTAMDGLRSIEDAEVQSEP